MDSRFLDRRDGGKQLLAELSDLSGRDGVVVLGLARGGLPVAFEVARGLGAPLDVFVVRKLGTPGQSELAMGAIASGGVRVLNDDVVLALELPDEVIEETAQREMEELTRREKRYRGGRPMVAVEGRTVVLVDDGLATGASMRAAARALERHRPGRIVIAVPVAAESTCEQFLADGYDLRCVLSPADFRAVGLWYARFDQTTDEEVTGLLQRARHALAERCDAFQP